MIEEIVVLSGKGGTGKTSISGSFAALADNAVLCDADVDAADLHLLLKPKVMTSTPFMGGRLAQINHERCVSCGFCRDVCKFDAISVDYSVNNIACEGCGVCVDMCPQQAIDFPVQQCGEWFHSETRFAPMIHARLGIAEENSGKLVSLVRNEARKLAESKGQNLIVTDGPPGIGCPVIAAIGGATLLAVVIEPTVSGVHDAKRVVELSKHFRVPGMVIINKYDLNVEMSKRIIEWAKEQQLEVAGKIPFDPDFVKAMIAGRSVVEYAPKSKAGVAIQDIWQKIMASKVLNSMGIADLRTIQ